MINEIFMETNPVVVPPQLYHNYGGVVRAVSSKDHL
jgi:hypothetical protein